MRRFFEPSGEQPFDAGLVLFFAGPASATGEDMAEFHHHGGPGVRRLLLAVLGELPATRPARAGEFSRRAFLAGKLDLTMAEGLADLIEAETGAQVRQAARQLAGVAGETVARWRALVVEALARAEAEIDFAAEEGDVAEDLLLGLRPRVLSVLDEMDRHLHAAAAASRLREGLVVAVTGPVNVGKSSLVNALARREVALVTAVPGTTRDVIEVPLELAGLPVLLLDTAGIRETEDPVEREGIRRARARAGDADLRLVLRTAEAGELPPLADGELGIVTKIDLHPPRTCGPAWLAVSNLSGEGLAALEARLREAAIARIGAGADGIIVRERHRLAIGRARACLAGAFADAPERSLDLRAEDLRLAAAAFDDLTGRISVEEVLDRIFAEFCIGK